MSFNIFERYRTKTGADGEPEKAVAPQEAASSVSDIGKARQELLARRQQLEQQIEIGGTSTPDDRQMLEDLDNRLRLLDKAA